MIIQFDPNISPEDPRVQSVMEKARQYDVLPEARNEPGTHVSVTTVYLKDGKAKSGSLPEHLFSSMSGVASVTRVTPARVSLSHNGKDSHIISLSDTIKIGAGLPCRIDFGPCTVDQNIGQIVESIAAHGVKMIRGGIWKPRSSPDSFPGYGEVALQWLLEAAAKNNIESVFIEVMESSDIEVVRSLRKQTGFSGSIVLWVGARTYNTKLLTALGKQTDFPVMLKHGLDATSIDDLAKRAEWVLAGENKWNDDGSLNTQGSLLEGNDRLILCLRGLRQTDHQSPWRFRLNNDWAEAIRGKLWAPICIDPSHSAGTMENDLVMTSVRDALTHNPALLMVEGGYPQAGFDGGFRGLCDVSQSLPIERLPELIDMVRTHNEEVYGKSVF